MGIRRRMHSLAAVVVLAGSVLIGTARPAAANHGCYAYPSTPWMSDFKTETVTGSNIAACSQTMLLLRSQALLHVWSDRTGQWVQVAEDDVAAANTYYLVASAKTSCAAQSTKRYRTRGITAGTWNGYGLSDQDDKWGTYYQEFRCSDPLREIHP